jgi:hypothetical protein
MLQELNKKITSYEYFAENFNDLKNTINNSDKEKALYIARIWVPMLYTTCIGIYIAINRQTFLQNVSENILFLFLITLIFAILFYTFHNDNFKRWYGLNIIMEKNSKFSQSWYSRCRNEQIYVNNFLKTIEIESKKNKNNTLISSILLEDANEYVKNSINSLRIMTYEINHKTKLLLLISLIEDNLTLLKNSMDTNIYNTYNISLQESKSEIQKL